MATPKSPAKPALTNEQKREWAQTLYTRDRLSQKEIAEKVGTSERTVCTWKEKFGWDALRKSLLITKEETLRRFYAQLEALTLEIETRAGKNYATTAESDTINKLAASIKALETETSVAEVFDVGRRFIDFVRSQDLEKAKEFVGYFDAFMQAVLGGQINTITPNNPRHRQ